MISITTITTDIINNVKKIMCSSMDCKLFDNKGIKRTRSSITNIKLKLNDKEINSSYGDFSYKSRKHQALIDCSIIYDDDGMNSSIICYEQETKVLHPATTKSKSKFQSFITKAPFEKINKGWENDINL